MKSMQHVLWRGALALGLMMLGVGSGIGLPAGGSHAEDAATGASACVQHGQRRLLEAERPQVRVAAPANAS